MNETASKPTIRTKNFEFANVQSAGLTQVSEKGKVSGKSKVSGKVSGKSKVSGKGRVSGRFGIGKQMKNKQVVPATSIRNAAGKRCEKWYAAAVQTTDLPVHIAPAKKKPMQRVQATTHSGKVRRGQHQKELSTNSRALVGPTNIKRMSLFKGNIRLHGDTWSVISKAIEDYFTECCRLAYIANDNRKKRFSLELFEMILKLMDAQYFTGKKHNYSDTRYE